MKNTALITGASSGIGRDLAKLHAEEGGDLVIVARRLEKLQTLKDELEKAHGVEVLCIDADLTEEGAIESLVEQLRESGIEIEVLINNAGFGGHGRFHEQGWEKQASMIDLNVSALCHLTHLVLQDMVTRQQGKILNVASTAGFLPGPLQAVYYASEGIRCFVLPSDC